VEVVKEMPPEIASKEPFKVDCSKLKGHFDYVDAVLPVLLEHQYISLTPAMSQRRDRYCSIIQSAHARSFCFLQGKCFFRDLQGKCSWSSLHIICFTNYFVHVLHNF
jgi:hypothetical protein